MCTYIIYASMRLILCYFCGYCRDHRCYCFIIEAVLRKIYQGSKYKSRHVKLSSLFTQLPLAGTEAHSLQMAVPKNTSISLKVTTSNTGPLQTLLQAAASWKP